MQALEKAKMKGFFLFPLYLKIFFIRGIIMVLVVLVKGDGQWHIF